MSYSYQKERDHIFTEEGQVEFLSIRDTAKYLLRTAGAFQIKAVIEKRTGDVWQMIACIDRLVELGEIRELTDDTAMGQHRTFVSG